MDKVDDLLCGGEEFYNWSSVFNSTDPKFSDCFEQLVLNILPCGYMWMFAIPYFFYIKSSFQSPIAVSKLFKARMALSIHLWILAWMNLGWGLYELSQNNQFPPSRIISPLALGLGMATAVFFHHYERTKGIRSSSYLTCYWIFCLLLWLPIFKTNVDVITSSISTHTALSMYEIIVLVTFLSSYLHVFVHFALSFKVDRPPVGLPMDPFLKTDEMNENPDAGKKTSPESSASFLSRMTFSWFGSMVRLGYKRPLVNEDLWDLNNADKCARVSRHFNKIWRDEKAKYKEADGGEDAAGGGDDDEALFGPTLPETRILIGHMRAQGKKGSPSLLKALVKTFGPHFFIGTLLKLLSDILNFVSPQLLSALILYTSNTAPVWQGYTLAGLMFCSAILRSAILQYYMHICLTTGMRIRAAVIQAIYEKSLVLSNAAKKESTVGEVVNLMSVDAQRFMDLCMQLNILWSGPFQIIVAMVFLWQYLGPSVLAGVALMIFLIPLNGWMARLSRRLQVKQMKFKDERIKLMNEILNGIRVLKMYAWETSFMKKVEAVRGNELIQLRNGSYLGAAFSFTWTCAPFLVSLGTFAVYVLSDPHHILDAQKAFVSLSLFDIMRFPMLMVPVMISSIVEANVSLKRLKKFLSNAELDLTNVDRTPLSRDEPEGDVINIDRGSFAWDKEEYPILNDITMSAKRGAIVAVVGQVGSGKSSLLSALLGDMEKCRGYVAVKGSIAYVPQQAWIQNLTVRDNITFGRGYDEVRYQDTIRACQLVDDFAMLPAGDQTEIGERGINLSGGQKQRVSLARAVYQDNEIYFLDDPLSAVDAHVGKNIFHDVIGPTGCLRDKTRILVTHGISFLPQVDQIIVLVDGRISEVGGYEELKEKSKAFSEFLTTYASSARSFDDDDDVVDDVRVLSRQHSLTRQRSLTRQLSVNEETMTSHEEADMFEAMIGSCDSGPSSYVDRNFQRSLSDAPDKCPTRRRNKKCQNASLPDRFVAGGDVIKRADDVIKKIDVDDSKLTTEEVAEQGNVKWSTVVSYLRAVGYAVGILFMLSYVLQNATQVYSSIWLSDWTSDPIINGTQNTTALRLGVYGALGMANAVMVVVTSLIITYGMVAGATITHSRMLNRVFRAPMSFFDTTPLGRIINRFSKDVYLIDEVIPRVLAGFCRLFFSGISTLAVIIYSTPIFAAVLLPIFIVYVFIQRLYVRTSRQLKRIESVSRSPVYSHFSETLTGVTTVRAYSLQQHFIKHSQSLVDRTQTASYCNFVSNRWLAWRLEVVGNLIVLFAAIFAVNEKGKIAPGIVGLSISYALQITGILNWMVRSVSEVETNVVAVERVEEYSNIHQEAPLTFDGRRRKPARDWPAHGRIKFEDYSTRYRSQLDLVVKNIDFNIEGGQKVGVVGRTGAGKSSLTLALFRIVEPASGRIVIDDINTSNIGLHDLRSKLSIIPQDPVLFSGPLRMNLDPFEAYSDDELWEALEHSHLKNYVTSLKSKLEHEITEGGDNLSVGQRQLVCLARALLRKSKILVLDEATAAVDLETDDLIQETIRSEFADCTIFTIAHRLNTIMDSDRVLVMDAGKVAEYDTPANLLRNKGHFYLMAKDAGLVS